MAETIRPGTRSLSGRLLVWYAVLVVAFITLFAFLVTSQMRSVLLGNLRQELVDEARLVRLALEADGQESLEEMAEAADLRITLIDEEGVVLADSAADPAGMESHALRAEVVEARGGRVGTARRVSTTTGEPTLYVALPPAEDGSIVRVAVTEDQITPQLDSVRNRVVAVAALAAVVGVAAVALVARRLVRPIEELTEAAGAVAEGNLSFRPRRSSVRELDRLGQAVGRMGAELGRQVTESESERRTLEVVLGALPDGVLLVEEQGAVAYANPTASALLGGVAPELRGLSPPALQRAVREARETGDPVTVEFERGLPARSLRAVATPFAGSDGRVLVVVGDITERQRVERMRRDFVADASHELKTPVASILASVETLRLALGRDPERAEGFLAQVEGSARQLGKIVEDLLDLSRLEVSDVRNEEVALDRVVEEVVQAMQGQAREAGVELTVSAEPLRVRGSAPDLGLAVRNLCDNAIRYTGAGGAAAVRLWKRDGWAVLEVEDTGAGIPTRALPRVFERFYRVDVARARATGGTGLGLAIVRHVAERHGGTVSVESELGAGSTFRVELPLG